MELLLVKEASYLEGYQMKLVFSNGEIKTVDLSGQLDKPIFKPLQQISFFKNFVMNPFTIAWPNGTDFAPEFLYALANEQAKEKEQVIGNH